MLEERMQSRSARVVVVGLGYAGLPMAVEIARAGFTVTGLDLDPIRVDAINAGRSPVTDVADAAVADLVTAGKLTAATSPAVLASADCALICVPTPTTPDHQPDLRFVRAAAQSIAAHAHPQMLVVLQSTCAPGTTRHEVATLLEERGLRVGSDVFVAFGPERIDPGNQRFTVGNTPKIVAGMTTRCTELAALFYTTFVDRIITVSTPEVAEMSKLVENTFRFININFVNELAVLCDRLGISVWEVIQAAATKPFAFMPHYPGPGVGGHCIPVVPYYLSALAREHGATMHMIDVAGRINDAMPDFVVAKLGRILAERGLDLAGARVLLLGLAYKPDVADIRESPAVDVLASLLEQQTRVGYYDPYVPSVQVSDTTLDSLSWQEVESSQFDCVVLLTAHTTVDYRDVGKLAPVIFDTRSHLSAAGEATIIRL